MMTESSGRLRRRKNEKYSALKEFKRDKISGKSRIESYKEEHQEPEGILQEVSEEEYSRIRQSRINNDFVVDDDGSGYVDYGLDEYEDEYYNYSDEDYHQTKKRKRGDKVPSKNIKHMFAKVNPKHTKKQNTIKANNNVDDEDFMSSIFGDLESKVLHSKPLDKSFNLKESGKMEALNIINNQDTEIKIENDVDFSLQESQDSFNLSKVKKEMSEKPIKVEEQESISDISVKSPISPTKSPILSPYKIKKEIVTLEESSIKKENKLEINGNFNKMEMSPNREIKIKKELEASLKAEINDSSQQEWVNIHQNISENKYKSKAGTLSNYGIDFEENNGKYFLFYWIDAIENLGTVYLLGKVYDKKNKKKYVSCCVTVNSVERNLFVLPRNRLLDDNGKETDKEVNIYDVYEELESIRKKHRILKWRCKNVTRKYAFEEPDVPAETNYIKAVYSFKEPQLPSDITGKTFSRIFGTNTSALELLIIKRKLMGPCWIKVTNYKKSERLISWCKTEVTVNSPKSINVCKEDDPEIKKEIPPFVVMCLNLKTVYNSKKQINEIVIASAMVYPEVNIMDHTSNARQEHNQFTIVRKLDEIPLPIGFKELLAKRNKKIDVVANETALLNYLMAIIQKQDPDIIVGHNFIGFHLDVLLHRMKALGIPNWSRIGRLRRTIWPNLQAGAGGMGESSIAERSVTCGRLLCDTYYGAKDYVKSSNNGLTHLSKLLLDIKREDIEPEKTAKYFWQANDLLHLIQHTEFDSFLSSALMFKIQLLPLTNQLTRLAGNLWSRTLCGARADRNEYLLLHEFHGKKFICPDKYDYKKRQNNSGNKKKAAYSGGLVLEPKKGFYDKYILLLDFNSLYPSIIQEFNICFTTVNRKDFNEDDEENNKIPDVPDPSLDVGVLPKLLKKLVQRRRQVKSILKTCNDPAEKISLDIRQKALKLTANSMYGCLGYNLSRFYAKPIAMLITSKGREILQNTVDLAEGRSYNVIYGDTDSIMINTNKDKLDEVKKIGNEIKQAVNNKYKLLEIEIDGYFRKMLLLKKKKYAALILNESNGVIQKTIEKKGIDVVRREWCTLSVNASNYVLEQLFSDNDREESLNNIYDYLQNLSEDIRNNKYQAEDFIINKSLSKNPEDYPDAKIQPHVQVALRLKSQGVGCHSGDTIQYVICKDENKKSYAERAYHPDELKKNKNLEIDYEWYLNQQILPPLLRLCEPIEETDGYKLSKCLGLDATKYQSSVLLNSNYDNNLYTFDSRISKEEKFKNVEKWKPVCYHCKQRNEFNTLYKKTEIPYTGFKCSDCNKDMPYGSLASQLHCAIRNHIKKYNNNVFVCDDICGTRTRQISVNGKGCLYPDCKGSVFNEYSDRKLFTQLEYYLYLFDIERFKNKDDYYVIQQKEKEFNSLKNIVDTYMKRSARKYVDFSKLFSFINIKKENK